MCPVCQCGYLRHSLLVSTSVFNLIVNVNVNVECGEFSISVQLGIDVQSETKLVSNKKYH